MRYFFILFTSCLFFNYNLYGIAEKYQLIDIGVLENESSEVSSINNKSEICGAYSTIYKDYAFVWSKFEQLNHLYFSAPRRLNMSPSVKLCITNSSIVYGTFIQWLSVGFWGFNGAEHEMLYKWENPFSYFTGVHTTTFGAPLLFAELESCSPSKVPFWDANDRDQLIIVKLVNDEHKISLRDYDTYREILNPYLAAASIINNHSQILGYYFEDQITSNGETEKIKKPVIYDFNEDQITFFNVSEEAWGEDLNDLGQVAGVIKESSGKLTGFFGTPEDFLKIPDFSPSALNNCGQLIGHSPNNGAPAIWEMGKLTLLSNLMTLVDDKGNTWDSIDKINDINDVGEIVGQGVYKGKPHGFLLVPIEGN